MGFESAWIFRTRTLLALKYNPRTVPWGLKVYFSRWLTQGEGPENFRKGPVIPIKANSLIPGTIIAKIIVFARLKKEIEVDSA